MSDEECMDCDGTGWLFGDPCPACIGAPVTMSRNVKMAYFLIGCSIFGAFNVAAMLGAVQTIEGFTMDTAFLYCGSPPMFLFCFWAAYQLYNDVKTGEII